MLEPQALIATLSIVSSECRTAGSFLSTIESGFVAANQLPN